MNSDSFDLQTISNRIFRFWWILILGGLIGSLLGFIANRIFIKPLFVADASISVLINFKEVGHLTQYEQDQMIGHVKSLFNSSEVIDKTVFEAGQFISNYDSGQFKKDCFLEQKVNEIIFRCKNNDPKIAMTLANTWSEISYSVLDGAFNHAKTYQSLTSKEIEFERCIELSAMEKPSFSECQSLRNEYSDLEEMTLNLQSEYEKSKGVFPGLTYNFGYEASLPEEPIRYHTNIMVFSTGLAGMIFAFLVIIIRFK